jgi:hypothetical protein
MPHLSFCRRCGTYVSSDETHVCSGVRARQTPPSWAARLRIAAQCTMGLACPDGDHEIRAEDLRALLQHLDRIGEAALWTE